MNRDLDRMLSQLVEEIERVEGTRRRFGAVMAKLKNSIDLGRFPAVSRNALEPALVKKIEPVRLDGLKIVGIDGGLVRRGFRSMDLLLTRGVAVVFRFGTRGALEVDFFPDAFPEPQIIPLTQRFSGPELDQFASLERLATELRVALNVIDKHEAELILIDGSLFFHPRDRPQNASIVYEKFEEVVALYKQLYNKASKKKTLVVGIIKDSRSSRVVSMLGDILPHVLREPDLFEMMQGIDYRWLLKISRDCDLLDTFLEEGERTFAFRYSAELAQNTDALEELYSWASSIWVTYLKTAKEDFPIRVELLGDRTFDTKQLDKALSAILPLSWQHPEYGIPTPILEADARARITHNETSLIVDRLMALSGLTYSSLEKRRSRNPFGG